MEKFKLPFEIRLEQNTLDPHNKTINIHYTIAKPGQASLKILDDKGKEVITLTDSYHTAGEYNAKLDGDNLQNGTYICRLQTLDVTLFSKMVLSESKQ